jgi:hypothetical protein
MAAARVTAGRMVRIRGRNCMMIDNRLCCKIDGLLVGVRRKDGGIYRAMRSDGFVDTCLFRFHDKRGPQD